MGPHPIPIANPYSGGAFYKWERNDRIWRGRIAVKREAQPPRRWAHDIAWRGPLTPVVALQA